MNSFLQCVDNTVVVTEIPVYVCNLAYNAQG
jgi:hypothetical protein